MQNSQGTKYRSWIVRSVVVISEDEAAFVTQQMASRVESRQQQWFLDTVSGHAFYYSMD